MEAGLPRPSPRTRILRPRRPRDHHHHPFGEREPLSLPSTSSLQRLWVHGRRHQSRGTGSSGSRPGRHGDPTPYYFDNYEWHTVYTNPANGKWFREDGQGLYRDLHITNVEGTVYTFVVPGDGRPYTLTDDGREPLFVDRGRLLTTFQVDTKGDDDLCNDEFIEGSFRCSTRTARIPGSSSTAISARSSRTSWADIPCHRRAGAWGRRPRGGPFVGVTGRRANSSNGTQPRFRLGDRTSGRVRPTVMTPIGMNSSGIPRSDRSPSMSGLTNPQASPSFTAAGMILHHRPDIDPPERDGPLDLRALSRLHRFQRGPTRETGARPPIRLANSLVRRRPGTGMPFADPPWSRSEVDRAVTQSSRDGGHFAQRAVGHGRHQIERVVNGHLQIAAVQSIEQANTDPAQSLVAVDEGLTSHDRVHRLQPSHRGRDTPPRRIPEHGFGPRCLEEADSRTSGIAQAPFRPRTGGPRRRDVRSHLPEAAQQFSVLVDDRREVCISSRASAASHPHRSPSARLPASIVARASRSWGRPRSLPGGRRRVIGIFR